MKKGQILEGIVERVDFPNKGVVRVREENGEEAVCIVKNVLPGQKVSFCVQKKRGRKAEGFWRCSGRRRMRWRVLVRISGSAAGACTTICPMRSSAG